jgi:hypothetical protein
VATTDWSKATHWEARPGEVESLTDERTKPTLQHTPDVVDHWNNTGNNTDQQTRIDYYNQRGKEDQAQVVMYWLNREMASGGNYTPMVGENFKEPGE